MNSAVNVGVLIVSATAFLIGSILLGKFFNLAFITIVSKLETRGNIVIPALVFAFFMAFFYRIFYIGDVFCICARTSILKNKSLISAGVSSQKCLKTTADIRGLYIFFI